MLSFFVYGKVIKRKNPTPKSHWNYRVGTRVIKKENTEYREFLIFTCYYSNGLPDGYGTSDINYSDELAGLKYTFGKIKDCFDKPTIDLDNFPNIYLNKD